MAMTQPAKKVTSRQELAELRKSFKSHTLMRLVSEDHDKRTEVNVGMGTCGIKAGSRDTMLAMLDEVVTSGLDNVSVMAVDCMDCDLAPVVEVKIPGKDAVRYKKVDAAIAKEIVKQHLIGGGVVESAKI